MDHYYPAHYYRRVRRIRTTEVISVGTPDTIDICKNCGEPIKWPNNTGAWVHVVSHSRTGIPDTDCVSPFTRQRVTSRGEATTNRQAVRKGS